MEIFMDERFEREALIIGKEAVEKLNNTRVALFGVGGVGSCAAEALARCGVGTVDITDNDVVSVTNINRQLCALTSTVGMPKVEVVASRMRDINPAMTVNTRREFFMPDNSADFDFSLYDYVIDAIDTVAGKIEIAVKAFEAGVPVISCMGAGNKLDPTAFCVTDLSKTRMCPLARVMRRELKKRGIEHMKVVYSEEPAITPDKAIGVIQPGKRQTPGSIAFVPSVAGFIAAGEAVKDIIGWENCQDRR